MMTCTFFGPMAYPKMTNPWPITSAPIYRRYNKRNQTYYGTDKPRPLL